MTDPQPVRVFVGLKLAPQIAEELAALARPLERHGARLVSSADIHLTLVPPWNETHITEVIETLRSTVRAFPRFSLSFTHLRYGPGPRYPRLLWVDCLTSNELNDLRTALLTAYGRIDSRPFQPHVTLARIPSGGRVIAQRNPMDRVLSLMQCVASVELFHSRPRGKDGYQVLASLPVGTKPCHQ